MFDQTFIKKNDLLISNMETTLAPEPTLEPTLAPEPTPALEPTPEQKPINTFRFLNVDRFNTFIMNYCPIKSEFLNLEAIKHKFSEFAMDKKFATDEKYAMDCLNFITCNDVLEYENEYIFEDFCEIFSHDRYVTCKNDKLLYIYSSDLDEINRHHITPKEMLEIPIDDVKSLVNFICYQKPISFTLENVERICEYATKFNIEGLCDQGFALACESGKGNIEIAKAIYNYQSKLLKQSSQMDVQEI